MQKPCVDLYVLEVGSKLRNVLPVIVTNGIHTVWWFSLCVCGRKGGKGRMAHTADDVIDQHVN